eukprot:COSAG06_NODE_4029_length_4643_cov_7.802597_6_plen_267_part_00
MYVFACFVGKLWRLVCDHPDKQMLLKKRYEKTLGDDKYFADGLPRPEKGKLIAFGWDPAKGWGASSAKDKERKRKAYGGARGGKKARASDAAAGPPPPPAHPPFKFPPRAPAPTISSQTWRRMDDSARRDPDLLLFCKGDDSKYKALPSNLRGDAAYCEHLLYISESWRPVFLFDLSVLQEPCVLVAMYTVEHDRTGPDGEGVKAYAQDKGVLAEYQKQLQRVYACPKLVVQALISIMENMAAYCRAWRARKKLEREQAEEMVGAE